MSQKLSDKITQYLIDHDHITRADLTIALEYQTRLPRSAQTDIEDILVDMEYISPEVLEQAKQASQTGLNKPQDRKAPQSAAAYYAAGYGASTTAPSSSPPVQQFSQMRPPAAPAQRAQPVLPPDAAVRPEFEQMLADLGLTSSTNSPNTQELPSHPKLGEYLLEQQHIADWQLMHAQCMLRDDPTVNRLDHLMVKLNYVSQDIVTQALKTLHQR